MHYHQNLIRFFKKLNNNVGLKLPCEFETLNPEK